MEEVPCVCVDDLTDEQVRALRIVDNKSNESEWELIKKMVLYARQRNVKVHGLGFTKTKLLPQYAFYSVDSASWAKSAGIGQQRQIFNGEYIEQRKINGNGKKIILSKLGETNMKEWVKYQRYMDRKDW